MSGAPSLLEALLRSPQLLRISAASFSGSAIFGAISAWSALLERAIPLPDLLELALWLHGAMYLSWQLTRRRTPSWLFALMSLALGAHSFFCLRAPFLFQTRSTEQSVSHAAGVLSTTVSGLPWLALLYAWSLCALAASTLEATRLAIPGPRAARLCWLPTVLVIGFGSLAVLGYATGSPWLLPE